MCSRPAKQAERLEGVVASGFLAAAMLDEAVVDEGGDVALDALGGDAGGGGDQRDGVAGVGDEAGEDDALGGVEVGNGADDAVFEADDEVAGVVVEVLGVGGRAIPTLHFALCGVIDRQPLRG